MFPDLICQLCRVFNFGDRYTSMYYIIKLRACITGDLLYTYARIVIDQCALFATVIDHDHNYNVWYYIQ